MKLCLYINGLLRDSVEIEEIGNLDRRKWKVSLEGLKLRRKHEERLSENLTEWHLVLELKSKVDCKKVKEYGDRNLATI